MRKITKVAAALGIVAGLGVAALPLASYAATVTENVNVSVTINPTLGTGAMACTDATTSGAAGVTLSATCSYTASSNGGLSVAIRSQGAELNLVGTGNSANTIAPIASQQPTVAALAVNGWGYRVSGFTGTGSPTIAGNADRYTPITATNVTVINASAGTAAGDFVFSARTPETQAPDTYTNVVTITTTAN